MYMGTSQGCTARVVSDLHWRLRTSLKNAGVFWFVIQIGRPRRIILRWNFRKWFVGVWTGSNWLSIVTRGGHL